MGAGRGTRKPFLPAGSADTARDAATARLRTGCSANGRQPPSLADHLGDADAELLVHDDHLATRDQRSVYRYVDRLTRQLVQLDDTARAQRQDLADRHVRSPQLDADLERHVYQQLDPVPLIQRGDLGRERHELDGMNG